MRVLSKSKLLAFRQCPKRLWLEVHRPDLREDSSATQASLVTVMAGTGTVPTASAHAEAPSVATNESAWGAEVVRMPEPAPLAGARRKSLTLAFARHAASRLGSFRDPGLRALLPPDLRG